LGLIPTGIMLEEFRRQGGMRFEMFKIILKVHP